MYYSICLLAHSSVRCSQTDSDDDSQSNRIITNIFQVHCNKSLNCYVKSQYSKLFDDFVLYAHKERFTPNIFYSTIIIVYS